MAVAHRRLQDEKHGVASPIKEISFEELAEKYYRLIGSKNRSWRRNRLTLDHLERFFRGKMISQIGRAEIDEYKHRREQKVSGPTINRELAKLSHIFTVAIEWKHANTNPTKGVEKYREHDPVERLLTADEEARLLAAASPQTRAILVIALNTGMRRNEILSLKWKNITEATIELERDNTKGGRRRRLVPLNAQALAAVKGIPRTSEYLFPSTGKRGHIADIKTSFKGACRRARKDPTDPQDQGITGLRLHDLRHTFASRLIDAGVDLVTTSRLLGHAHTTTTERYVHKPQDRMREAVEKLAQPERNPESPAAEKTEPQPELAPNPLWN